MAGRNERRRRVGYQDAKVGQSSDSGLIMSLWKEQGGGRITCAHLHGLKDYYGSYMGRSKHWKFS